MRKRACLLCFTETVLGRKAARNRYPGAAAAAAVLLAFGANHASAQVTTSQYNNMQTGATLTETILTPRNVNFKQFGKVGAFKVDGAVYAQPLFVTPDGDEGGIWTSDTGPAADASGNIYLPTANGTFDAASGGRDYGDTELKLAVDGSSFAIRDYFTPYWYNRSRDRRFT